VRRGQIRIVTQPSGNPERSVEPEPPPASPGEPALVVAGAPIDADSGEDLRLYVRRSAIQAIVVLALLVALLGALGLAYEAELLAATAWVHRELGVPGLFGIVLACDGLGAPIPPDLVLVVTSKTPLAASWKWLVPGFGVASASAGTLGWWLGKRLGETRLAARLLGRRRRARGEKLVARYGRWAVAIGAVTPIPFSITCWIAGTFRMPFTACAPMTLLRIPRYLVYYLAIAYSEAIVRALSGG
jgi:membrane protein YqaA with SNARE-associated domain